MFANLTLTRPRLFFNPDFIAARKKQLTPFQQEFLATLRKRLDALSEDPNKNYPGESWKRPVEYGHNAAYAALLWLFTGEEPYKQKGIAWLSWFTDWCNNRFANKQAVSWYSYSRIAALCAYDWLYDLIPETERSAKIVHGTARMTIRNVRRSPRGKEQNGKKELPFCQSPGRRPAPITWRCS